MKSSIKRSIYAEMLNVLKNALAYPEQFIKQENHSLRVSMAIYFHFILIYFAINVLFSQIVKDGFINRIETSELLIEYSPILKAYFTHDVFLSLLFMTIHLIILPLGFSITSVLYTKLNVNSYKNILSQNFIFASFITPLYFIPFPLIFITMLSIICSTLINYWMNKKEKFFNTAYIIQQLIHLGLLTGLIVLNFV